MTTKQLQSTIGVILLSLSFAKSGDRRTVLISDLHFGVGRINGQWHRFEDFRWGAEFQAFLNKLVGLGPESTDLVLVGDTFELWQSLGDECAINVKNQGCSEAEALVRLKRVLESHAGELRALGTFAGLGNNRVILIPGNHDAAILFPAVGQRVLESFGDARGRVSIADNGFWLSPDGAIYAEHGQQIGEDVNGFDDWPHPFLTDRKTGLEHLQRTWGEQFVQGFYNDVERKYAVIDNISEERAAVSYGLAAEGKIRSALTTADFLHFLLFGSSLQQAVGALDNPETPRWDVSAARSQGDRFLVESIPTDSPVRAQAETALSQGVLGLSIANLTDDEIRRLCDQRLDRFLGQKNAGLKPTIEECPTGALNAALGRRSRDAIFGDHLLAVHARLSQSKQVGAKPFSAFVYGHTHAPHPAFDVRLGDWRPSVINTGAWQRRISPQELDAEKKAKGYSDKEVLSNLTLDGLTPCYSVVVVEPYGDKPQPELKFWAKEPGGTWDLVDSCN